MTDRVIRDELLTSERYWSVSIEAQRLFVHLILVVDNLGRFSGKNFTIRSACFPGQAVAPEKLEKMLSELHDADLVRIYQVENQRYIFVPRFRQHLRYTKRSLYPSPPKEINDIVIDSHSEHMVRTVSAPKKRSEVKRSEEKLAAPPDGGSTVWDFGKSLLAEQGLSTKSAGALIGSWLRDWDESTVAEALRAAAGKADIKAYVAGVLKNKPKRSSEPKEPQVAMP